MKAALENYYAWMQRVLDHIDLHLDVLSDVAALSKYHFHRQFTSTFGLSVHRCPTRPHEARIAKAGLLGRPSVMDIAMDAGYGAPDAFARASRQRFGQSPSSFRKVSRMGHVTCGLRTSR
ncbi:helix-turn-helix domain-containing protein [Rhizobium sp. PL01]|uniref:helix-turn-helix domain-containing protein n=1 Tax=Rhizobium sp. PL01 TaxID=3085631 RepID=UPI0029810CB0|nr:helix-turn-helix domain-containing protein [Rhizobium sp. PL01]MDW5317527.1 helix-turn-helix domain-containing protein [Rhizobium sp. PL01]